MYLRLFLYFLFLISLLTIPLRGQEPVYIEVESRVDTSVITIGDRITYSILIKRDKELNIARPGAGVNLGMFEIKSYDFPEPKEEGGLVTEQFHFTISVFDTGKYTIPPFPVAYFEKDTSAYQIIEAAPIDIYVKSLLSGEETPELKDIKPPVTFPFNYLLWTSLAALLILIAALSYVSYRLWKKRKEKGYLFRPPPPPRPAHEVALEALHHLYASDLLENRAFKPFFSELSEIIRNYLEGRYFISAMEETTGEILRDVREHFRDETRFDQLRDMLTLSDMVKFARYLPKAPEIDRTKDNAMDFVNGTKLIFVSSEERSGKPETVAGTDQEKAVINETL